MTAESHNSGERRYGYHFGNHAPMAMHSHIKMEELLDVVFPTWSVPRLHCDYHQEKFVSHDLEVNTQSRVRG
jgi:hypothetical protein